MEKEANTIAIDLSKYVPAKHKGSATFRRPLRGSIVPQLSWTIIIDIDKPRSFEVTVNRIIYTEDMDAVVVLCTPTDAVVGAGLFNQLSGDPDWELEE